MKLKRSIRMLMCCLAAVGTLTVNSLTAEAAMCTHPYFQEIVDVEKYNYHDANYHYSVFGTHCVCPCGYEYWKNLQEVKSFHTWEIVEDKQLGVKFTWCRECHYKPEIVIVSL